MSLHYTPTSGTGLIQMESYMIMICHYAVIKQFTWYQCTPAEPPTIDAYMTIPREMSLEDQDRQDNGNCNQPQYNIYSLDNQPPKLSHQNNDVKSHNQSPVLLQQFSVITQELQNLTKKVSNDLNKITQACTSVQETYSKLIQDAVLQALAKPQGNTHPSVGPPWEPNTLTLN